MMTVEDKTIAVVSMVPMPSHGKPGMGSSVTHSGAPNSLDGDRGANVHPVVKIVSGVAAGERDPYAAVGSGPIWHRGVAVNEHISIDLNAPWHWGKVIKAGPVHSFFGGSCRKLAVRGPVAFTSCTYMGRKNQGSALISHERLAGLIDDYRLGTLVDMSGGAVPLNGGKFTCLVPIDGCSEVS
jgi:hypothetical protein